MTSLESVLSASKTEPAGKAAVAGKVVLVMQGGGAQAAYEGGVYEALHEAGIEPDWVIGTSIGAINGSIIAGNEVKSRLKRLREFWSRIESRPTWPSGPMFGNAANQFVAVSAGGQAFRDHALGHRLFSCRRLPDEPVSWVPYTSPFPS